MNDNQMARNKATFRRFHEAMNTGDPAIVSQTIDEIVDPDVLIRTPLPLESTGPELLKEVFTRLRRAFPDLHIAVQDVIAEDDKVVCRNTVTGTHLGEYLGLAATGRPVVYNEIFIVRFVAGRIAETWGVVDILAQMRQLGMIPVGPGVPGVPATTNETPAANEAATATANETSR
jgi:steroid delta-isomerase-like uncharacterized protein